jgi:hypothetical protein
VANDRRRLRSSEATKARVRRTYLALVEQLRSAKGAAGQRRLIDELARLTFGC